MITLLLAALACVAFSVSAVFVLARRANADLVYYQGGYYPKWWVRKMTYRKEYDWLN